MTRPVSIRHDDILGRLDWIESQIDAMSPKSRRGAAADPDMMADAYPVQMTAPGVFPPDREQIPASETFAVVDSIRAKEEGRLRHDRPLHPMDAPPIDQLAADARMQAHDNFQADREALEDTGKMTKARGESMVEASHRAENDAVGNPITGARTGEFRGDAVTVTGEDQTAGVAPEKAKPDKAPAGKPDEKADAKADENAAADRDAAPASGKTVDRVDDKAPNRSKPKDKE